VRSMTACFEDPSTGGCQARIDNRATSPRMRRFLERSGAQTNHQILEDTIRAERGLYPWILSGNSMYRREALRAAGEFDTTLPACEDVDLAWRVVLLGYQLAYCDDAIAVHYNDDPWLRHLRKAWRYGAASARLARRYLPGGRGPFRAAAVITRDIDASLLALNYWLGYRAQALGLAAGVVPARDRALPEASQRRFRSPFTWRDDAPLRISEDVVYWSRAGTSSVIVHLPSRARMGLDEAGHDIWSSLVEGSSRDATVRDLSRRYGISETTAAADLDDLVEELLDAGVLVPADGVG
jgi:Coenzyme PQQ synthesis protein D (PqqD)